MSTEEKNRLIAYFDGYYESPYPNTPNKVYKLINGIETGFHLSVFKYHEDWSSLMLVWEKIMQTARSMGVNMVKSGTGLSWSLACMEVNIGPAYSAVVEAIQIINSQKDRE